MPQQTSATERISSRRHRQRRWWRLICLGCTASCTVEVDLFHAIAEGDVEGLEQYLRCLQTVPVLLAKRRSHPNKMLGTFFQESSPAIWAVECCQWHLLPLLSYYGYDVNRPQFCRRWTCFCHHQLRPNNFPYRRVWTKGQYTYQSILDYFFASTYERLGELKNTPLLHELDFMENTLSLLLSQAEKLLIYDVDVHRIDSIIVFSSLADSFNQYICNYFDANDGILTDIPKQTNYPVELKILRLLVENGFSEFEFMEYVSPNTNWLGILICLLAHPRLCKLVEANRPVPPLLRSAAILLVNLLVWRHSAFTSADLRDSVNNLGLRKVYFRRYADQQDIFSTRIASLLEQSDNLLRSPPTLSLLARNRIRRLLGGKGFKSKLASLGLPKNLSAFLALIGTEHMTWVRASPFVVAVATGKLTAASFEKLTGVSDRRGSSCSLTGEQSPVTVPPSAAEVLDCQLLGQKRGTAKRRASACSLISRLQQVSGPVLRIQRSSTSAMRRPRPNSAPVSKLTPKVTHRSKLPLQ